MNQQSNQWSSITSGIKNRAAPIPISFAIPENYTATGPNPNDPVLLDPFTVRFNMQPPLILPENCSCGLTQASFAYSQPNIVGPAVIESAPNGNNRITIDFGSGPVDIVLDEGLYTFTDVETFLNIWVRQHDPTGVVAPPATPIVAGTIDLFTFTGIAATQKLVISLNAAALNTVLFPGPAFPAGGIVVNFANPSPTGNPVHAFDSIGGVLGWPTTGPGSSFTTSSGGTGIESFYAPNVAGFSDTSAYTLYMSIVTNSYQNGSTGQLLYSFPLGAFDPNSVASFQPTLRYPVQLTSGTYSGINVWTADQSGNRFPWSRYQAPFQFSAIISKNKEDGSM